MNKGEYLPQNGYYITKDGKRVELIFASNIFLYGLNITHMIIPEWAHYIECDHNHITTLYLPESVIDITCDLMNGIEEQDRWGLNMNIFQSNFVY